MSKRAKSVAFILVLAVLGGVSMGQESFKDMVEQQGFAWIVGRWKATMDDGQDVVLTFQWVAQGHAIATGYAMGENTSAQGVIYFDADQQQVRQFSVDSQGKVIKGTWDVQDAKAILKTTMANEYGEPVPVGITYAKVNSVMKVEVYGLQDGELSSTPYAELDFKKATLALASEIEGKWTGTYETDNGVQDVTVTYKVEGNKISGYFTTDNGRLDINPGKISGDAFEYTFDWQGYTLTHKCKRVGKEIKVAWEVEGYEGEFTLKKAAK